MSELPFLPLFVDAYESDTSHLSDAEHGRYFALLRLIWKSPECRIPNDDAWLARKLARPVDAVKKQVRPLIEEFCQTSRNFITQKRLRDEWKRARERSKKQSERAKSRWEKNKDECRGNAERHASGNASIPIPTTTDTKKKVKKESGSQSSPDLLDAVSPSNGHETKAQSDWPSDAFDQFWKKYPHKVGKKAALKAFAAAKRTGVTWARMTFALDRYIHEKPPDRAWCNPATWLNQGRWDDEPATHDTRKPNGNHASSRTETILAGVAESFGLHARDGERTGRPDDEIPPGRHELELRATSRG